MASDASAYPVQFDIARDDSQNRITNFPLFIGMFIRSILLIPHFVILYFFAIVVYVLYLIAQFAILFSGVYPEGMYNLVAVFIRWNSRMNGYLLSLFDKYPPFNGNEDDSQPLIFSVVRPDTSSRLLNFPFFGPMVRSILLLPHLIIVMFLGMASFVVVFIAHFAILFTGSFPAGMHAFCVGVQRWSTRISSYLFGLTDAYPPFSMK